MGLVWFRMLKMMFYLSIATCSFAKLEENDDLLVHQSSNIQLNVYHVQGSNNPSASSTSALFDALSRDEEHVRALSNRLLKQVTGTTTTGFFSMNKSSSGNPFKANSAASIPVSPGLSIGSGNYYVKLGLGYPPKYYAMVFDTGSSLSWLQCQPCAIYCHSQLDPLFNPSASKTYKTLKCGTPECSSVKTSTLNDPLCQRNSNACIYTASYGDQSYSVGYLSQDLLTLTPSETLPRFTFGCGQDNQGLFGRAAGIIGLARDKLSMLAQLSPKYGYSFSYCLPTATASSSASFGSLSIGQLVSPSSYKFTPMIINPKNPSLYFLRLAAITVAGRPLALASTQYSVPTIIDSGTVITRLPTSVYAALSQEFVKILSKKFSQGPAFSILDTCFKGNARSIFAAAPQIGLIFQGGADMLLGPSNILVETDGGLTCLAFASSSFGSGSNQISIIGNCQQQTFNIAYDVSSSRIGFAPGGCR